MVSEDAAMRSDPRTGRHEDRRERLRRRPGGPGSEAGALRSCCLDVAYYNTLVGRVKNKAQVLFIAVTQLIQSLLNEFPDDTSRFRWTGRGGGPIIARTCCEAFPAWTCGSCRKGTEASTYEMRTGGRTVRLSFEVEADDLYLPVSLASMVSKYRPRAAHGLHERVLRRHECGA